jgi:predicted MPP superfamily phosphohydrolase
VECFDVRHPAVTGAHEGVRILHLSDLHVRRVAPASARTRALLEAVASVSVDLVAITGDIMDEPGDEAGAVEMLRLIVGAASARAGVVAVLGNHDRPELARGMAGVDGLTTLGTGPTGVGFMEFVAGGGGGVRVVGMSWPEDVLGLIDALPAPAGTLCVGLAHHPGAIVGAAEVGLELLLAGHTHAGQVRLHTRYAPHTSSDLPAHLATGVLRLRETLCCVSRGIGDGVVEGLRVNCPRQAPLYTLRRGELPPVPRGGSGDVITQVRAW